MLYVNVLIMVVVYTHSDNRTYFILHKKYQEDTDVWLIMFIIIRVI